MDPSPTQGKAEVFSLHAPISSKGDTTKVTGEIKLLQTDQPAVHPTPRRKDCTHLNIGSTLTPHTHDRGQLPCIAQSWPKLWAQRERDVLRVTQTNCSQNLEGQHWMVSPDGHSSKNWLNPTVLDFLTGCEAVKTIRYGSWPKFLTCHHCRMSNMRETTEPDTYCGKTCRTQTTTIISRWVMGSLWS